MYFVLFTDIKLTRGRNRSCLIDMRSGKMTLIDNAIEELLSKRLIDREAVDEGTGQLLDHLVETEHGFYCRDLSEASRFPEMSAEFDHPATIMTAIIEVSETTYPTFAQAVDQLEELGCQHIEIRCFLPATVELLDELMRMCDAHDVPNIALRLDYAPGLEPEYLSALLERADLNVFDLQVYSCPEGWGNGLVQEISEGTRLGFNRDPLDSRMCGLVQRSIFRANLDFFHESLKHNTCLNKKISIDKNSEIKHCPSMRTGFGQFPARSLLSIAQAQGFTKLWALLKNEVDTCRDCEFRNVCTDCRAYLLDPSDERSKPLKCGYDPSTNVWEPWATNPLAKAAITRYDLSQFLA